MNPILIISARDNVATALEPLEPGRTIGAGDRTVTVIDAIPRGHKLALLEICPGEHVVKFGSPIGVASARIAEGAHVHTHNVASARGRGDLPRHTPSSVARIAEPPDRNDEDDENVADVAAGEPRPV